MARAVRFFRAGYPAGAPRSGYISLMALLPRRLSDDKVSTVAAQIPARAAGPAVGIDIGVAITRITRELPTPEDVDRVAQHLRTRG